MGGLRGRILTFALIIAFAAAALATAMTWESFAAPDADDGQTSDGQAAEGQAADETVLTGGPVEGGAYEVTAYTLHATVNKDHSYDVEEKISVNIPDQLTEIGFAIPSGNFRTSNIKVENTAYKADKSHDANKVVITDGDKLLKGAHEYTISYRIREYQDRDSTKDIFFYNVLLPEWKQPIGKVDIEVSFPDDFPFDDMQCYAGQFGVQDSTNKITFKKSDSSKTVTVTGKLIPENYGITLKAQLENGYWTGALNGSWAFAAVMLSMAAAVAALTILWYIGGRDPKIKKQKVTKPLEGLSPVELGYVFNSRIDIRDILHMLLDFAIKGYLRISEYESKQYRIFREEEPEEEEKMFRNAYNILFEDVFKGRSIELEDIVPRLALIKRSISDDVASGFASAESSAFTPLSRIFRYAGAAVFGLGLALANAFSYVYTYQTANYVESILMGIAAAAASLLLCSAIDTRDSSPVRSGNLYEILAAVAAAIPVLYVAVNVMRNTRNPVPAFMVMVLAAAAVFLVVIMRARGSENAALISGLRQLRHFIYHPTPKELLENHMADDKYYYEMLIYALAFGAEESWAISFLTLDVPEPEWFTNDLEGEAFSNLNVKKETVDYARDIKSFVRTVENAYNEMNRRSGRNR